MVTFECGQTTFNTIFLRFLCYSFVCTVEVFKSIKTIHFLKILIEFIFYIIVMNKVDGKR